MPRLIPFKGVRGNFICDGQPVLAFVPAHYTNPATMLFWSENDWNTLGPNAQARFMKTWRDDSLGTLTGKKPLTPTERQVFHEGLAGEYMLEGQPVNRFWPAKYLSPDKKPWTFLAWESCGQKMRIAAETSARQPLIRPRNRTSILPARVNAQPRISYNIYGDPTDRNSTDHPLVVSSCYAHVWNFAVARNTSQAANAVCNSEKADSKKFVA